MPETVRIGGLMRCCLGTLDRVRTPEKPPPAEGDVIRCDHCSDSMIFRAGAWQWNRREDFNPSPTAHQQGRGD